MSDLTKMPGHLFRRVHQISTAIFAEECAAFGLTSVQYAALSVIAGNPGVDATRLSSLIGFDRSTLADVLERLETRGWVIRSPGANDRRIKRLRLSQAGSQLLAEVQPAVARVQQRLLMPLPREDGVKVIALLAQLIEAHGGELSDAPAASGGTAQRDPAP